MTLPTFKVEADFTGNPFGSAFTPTDITTYALTTGDAGTPINVTGGRQDEVSQVSPATFTIVLDNDTLPGGDDGGRFSPSLTGLVLNLFTPDVASPGCVTGSVAGFTPASGATLTEDTTGQLPYPSNPCTLKVSIPSGVASLSNIATTPSAPATAGLAYSAAMQVKNNGPTVSANLSIQWLNNVGGVISTVLGSGIATGNTGYAVVTNKTAPAGTVAARLLLTTSGGATTATTTWYAGNFELVQAAVSAFETVMPFYPHIDVGLPIRVSLVVNATTYPIAFGTATGIIPSYTSAGFAIATVSVTDILGRLGTQTPLRDLFSENILQLDPSAFYPLQEPDGSISFGDATGVNAPAVVINAKGGTGGTGGTGDALTAVGASQTGLAFATKISLANSSGVSGSGSAILTDAMPPASGPFTIVIVAGQKALSPNIPTLFAAQARIGFAEMSLIASGPSSIQFQLGDGSHSATSLAPWPDDGNLHVIICTLEADLKTANIYIDGQLAGVATPSGTALGSFATLTDPFQLGNFISPIYQLAQVSTWDVDLAFFAVIPGTALSAGQIATITKVAQTAGEGTATGTHITKLLGFRANYGFTASAGIGTIGPHDTRGVSLLQALQDTAKAEGGYLYSDGNGKVIFQNRNQVNPPVAFVLTASSDQVDPTTTLPLTDQYLVNDYTVSTPTGAAQRAFDQASQDKYGVYAASPDTLIVDSDETALNAASWRVNNNKTPRGVMSPLVFDLLTETNAGIAADVAGFQPLLRVQLAGMPSSAPPGDGVIQGWAWSIALDKITVAFATTPVPETVMVWDGGAAQGWGHAWFY